MSDGMKMALVFLSGAAVGAAGLALINRKKIDVDSLKPLCASFIAKGMEIKDEILRNVEAMRGENSHTAADAPQTPKTGE